MLDLDLTGPSIPRLLGVEGAKVTQAPGGWRPVEVYGGTSAEVEVQLGGQESGKSNAQDGVSNGLEDGAAKLDLNVKSTLGRGRLVAMSLGFLLQSRGDAVVWRGPKKTAMVRQFLSDVLWGQLDYLLIDTPPGTSDEHISLAESIHSNPSAAATLRGAVIVTTPQAVATADVKKELNFCKKTGVPVMGVIENMAGFACPCCGEITNVFSKGGGKVMAQEWNVRYMGGVPIDQTWGVVSEGLAERTATGVVNQGEVVRETLVEKYEKCHSMPVFMEITQRVVDICEGREPAPVAEDA